MVLGRAPLLGLLGRPGGLVLLGETPLLLHLLDRILRRLLSRCLHKVHIGEWRKSR